MNLLHTFNHMFQYMTPRLWMLGIILPFCIAMVITLFVHPFILKMALKKNMVDAPDYRKLQKTPVPVMGGLAVYFGIITGAGATSMFFNSYALFSCFVALTVMMYVGMLDDMIGLSPVLRLLIEIGVIGFIVKMDLVSINDMHGVFGIGKLPVWISIPLVSVAGCGIINAINMIDGVDGLGSGFCLFACLCFGFVFCASFDGTMSIMAALTAGALMPFFFHNVFGKKTKMFMGDAGTQMMGMLMTIFCMRMIDNTSLVQYNHPRMGVVAFCLSVLSIPVFDTLRVMVSRILRGRSPFHPDKSHLHHLFIEIGFSHIGTAMAVISLNALNLLCWLVTYLLGGNVTVQFVVVVVVAFMNTTVFYYVVRKMNHARKPYIFLTWLAKKSHKEASKSFLAIRNVMDRL